MIDRLLIPDITLLRPYAGVVATALLVTVLAGCSSPVGFATSSLAPEQGALVYYQWIRSASWEAREIELKNLRAAVPVNPAQHKLKLAMLLSVPPDAEETAVGEATLLLQELLADADNSAVLLPLDYQIFASHWVEVLSMRQQLQTLGADHERTVGELSDLQNRQADLQQRYDLLSGTLVEQEQRNEELRQRNGVIQRQLDALNGIEQQLIEQGGANASGGTR